MFTRFTITFLLLRLRWYQMSHMSFGVYPMSESDLSSVIGLWSTTDGIGLNESDTSDRLKTYLRRNPGQSFVAREGKTNRLIGAVLCGNDGRRGYLHHLAVETDARGCGVGRELVRRCLVELEKCDIAKCNLFVYDTNISGKMFWEKLGWISRIDLRVMQKGTRHE